MSSVFRKVRRDRDKREFLELRDSFKRKNGFSPVGSFSDWMRMRREHARSLREQDTGAEESQLEETDQADSESGGREDPHGGGGEIPVLE